jgi:hypothetical protein
MLVAHEPDVPFRRIDYPPELEGTRIPMIDLLRRGKYVKMRIQREAHHAIIIARGSSRKHLI